MYKILLADDDKESLKNFKKYIENTYTDFKIIKSIHIAKCDYIEDIVKWAPQLIIADVRFFGANSSHTFSEISKRLPWARFILYGSLNDMEYLKKSIEGSGLDYMIKPVKPTDLGRKLESAKEYLDLLAERELELKRVGESFKENKSLFKNLFLQNLVKGNFEDEDEIRENFSYFDFKVSNNFTVVQIKIDGFKELILTQSIEKKHYLIYNILNIVQLAVSRVENISFINSFNCITLILSGIEEIDEIYKVCNVIKNDIGSKLNVGNTIGIGRTYESPVDIPISYNEAEKATSHRFYMGYNTIIPIEFVEERNYITYRSPVLKEKKLIVAAVTGEFEYCKNLLSEIFGALRKLEPLPPKLVSQIVIEILISIGRYLREQNKFDEINMSRFFPASKAMEIKDIDEGYTYLYSNLEEFCKFIAEQRTVIDKKILDEAEEYAQLKYYETISLQKAAFIVKTTPDYLNKLFVLNENESYFEHVTRVRLENAKKFLANTDMDDNMIAVNVGYDDGKYFKAVFRQYENIDTSEFRSKFR